MPSGTRVSNSARDSACASARARVASSCADGDGAGTRARTDDVHLPERALERRILLGRAVGVRQSLVKAHVIEEEHDVGGGDVRRVLGPNQFDEPELAVGNRFLEPNEDLNIKAGLDPF